MERMLTWMTGAQGPEIKKTVYSFWALFFLLFSYYLIKPLRTSQFLKEFSPDILPLFFLIIAGGLLVTGYWLTCVWYAGGIYDSQKTNPKVESVAA